MKLTSTQQVQLRELAFAEVPNKEIAERMGLPLTEIHAARHRMGITRDKVAAAKSNTVVKAAPTKSIINKDFEAAVQQMEADHAKRNKPTEPHTCMTCCDSLCHAKGTNCIISECKHYQSKEDWCKEVLARDKKELFTSLTYWSTGCIEKCDIDEIKSVLNKHIPDNWGKRHV